MLAKPAVDDIAKQIAAMLGTTCWKNSTQARAAIAGAIAVAADASTAASHQPPKRSKKN